MTDYKKMAAEYIDSAADIFIGVSDAVWDTPELSLKEFKAHDIYLEALEKLGFEIEDKICGIDTAFCGKYGSGRPYIGILAEYDALSGLSQQAGETEYKPVEEGGNGHGCGHNLLGGGSLAAAAAVKDFLEKSGREGTVFFYGCPGEEGCSSKAYMAREGLWTMLDAALCWHPSDVNQVTTGTNNSCLDVLYKFKGLSAHAAADPHNGRSALDAVELMNIGTQFLREHMTDDCRVHYAITDTGGISANVVQSKASVLYMVRANKVRDSVALLKRVDKIAQGAALMTETSYERVFIDGTAETLPNYTMEKILYDNFEQIGVPEYTQEEIDFAAKLRESYDPSPNPPGIGAKFDDAIAKQVKALTENMTKPINDFLMPMYSGTGFMPGSTDVGDVSWLTPTAQVEVVTWPSDAPGHSWQAVSCGKSSMAHKGMLTAGKVMALTAIDLICCPELLAAAKAEFTERAVGGYVCPIEPDAVPIAL